MQRRGQGPVATAYTGLQPAVTSVSSSGGTLFPECRLAPPKDRASVHPPLCLPQAFKFLKGVLAAPSPDCEVPPVRVSLVPWLWLDPAAGSREHALRVTGLPQTPALLRQPPSRVTRRQGPRWAKLTVVTPFFWPMTLTLRM